MTEHELRVAVRDAGLRLQAEGLIARTWGNVSVRLDDKRMLITPSGIPYEFITPDMIVAVDIATDEWTGNFKPSGERKLHAAIYRLRPDVNSVIHTHQNAASVLAACGKSMPFAGTEIQCAPYGLPGTKKLTNGTSAALGDNDAAFMANHGAVCAGKDIQAAFEAARSLEQACSEYLSRANPTLPAKPDQAWDDAWLVPAQAVAQEARAGEGQKSAEDQDSARGQGSVALYSTAPYTVAYSRLRKNMRAVLDDIAQIVGPKLPVIDSETSPGGKAAVNGLRGNGSLLIADKGALCVYPTRPDAEAAAMVIEKTARALIAGEAIGGARVIVSWEAALMRFVYKNSYSKQAKKG